MLRHKIDIESNSETVNSFGEVVAGWSALAASVPATVTPLRGVQREQGAQTQTELTHKVTIRYSSDVSAVTAKHRVKYGSRYFDIESVVNVGERNRMIELMCVEHD